MLECTIRCCERHEQIEANLPVFQPFNDSYSQLLSLGIGLRYIITIATDADAPDTDHKIRFQRSRTIWRISPVDQI